MQGAERWHIEGGYFPMLFLCLLYSSFLKSSMSSNSIAQVGHVGDEEVTHGGQVFSHAFLGLFYSFLNSRIQ